VPVEPLVRQGIDYRVEKAVQVVDKASKYFKLDEVSAVTVQRCQHRVDDVGQRGDDEETREGEDGEGRLRVADVVPDPAPPPEPEEDGVERDDEEEGEQGRNSVHS